MRPKPVRLRSLAEQDVSDALSFYLDEEAYGAASRFSELLEEALRHIGSYPGGGSPRYAVELAIPGLRYWRVPGFPHLVFYVDRGDYVDVWRILHEERDLHSWVSADE